jgi:hypothetical protein
MDSAVAQLAVDRLTIVPVPIHFEGAPEGRRERRDRGRS